jgi:hypothetical protein
VKRFNGMEGMFERMFVLADLRRVVALGTDLPVFGSKDTWRRAKIALQGAVRDRVSRHGKGKTQTTLIVHAVSQEAGLLVPECVVLNPKLMLKPPPHQSTLDQPSSQQ